jgi:hypothetical protein
VQQQQRNELAGYLAGFLPALDLRASTEFGHDGRPGEWDPDLACAIRVEVGELVARSPALRTALADVRRGADPRQLVPALAAALDGDDPHRAEVLWALLGGDPQEPVAGQDGRWHRFTTDGWLARGFAAGWMNVLVMATVVIGVLAAGGGLEPPAARESLAVTLLRLFTLWCLAFLPGWLYIRFLGQRAGSVWQEFVVHLHRLGWDEPQFLPRPPESSQFRAAWQQAGGALLDQRRNLYRLKFDSYYGRSVVENVHNTNFAVRVETMFPVFLATAVFSVGWFTVLWDTAFLADPTSLWDVLRFAFLGAYVFIVQSLIRRYFQNDLRPSAYAHAVLRIVVVLLVVVALHQVMPGDDPRVEAAVAFVVGIFPIIALQALQRIAASTLRVVVPQLSPDYPLNQLDGLDIWYEARLLEEGIEDMQNLRTANLVDVMLHTRVPVGRLVDWVDQATLYVHLDRIERGFAERRLVRQARNAGARAQRVAHRPDRKAPEPAPATPDPPAVPSRIRGSVNPALRAGTETRVRLRQLGIRTATDLLKAFPPDQIDPREPPVDDGSAAFRHPFPAEGLDVDQIRTLVRVLDEDTHLAPVWNWQAHGVVARRPEHRPRSAGERRPPSGRVGGAPVTTP